MLQKIAITIVFFGCITARVSAQNISLFASPNGAKVLGSNGDTLLNPWCGGWVYPEFSSIDLNGDGLQDLFVFVPGYGDNRTLTFLNLGNGQYQYAPEYESFFPNMIYWALLVDYNKDGKPDIFTYSQEGGAIDVYKNISDSNGLKFTKVTYSPNPYRDYICFENGSSPLNVYILSTDLPAIADLDGDGDIDILAFDPTMRGALYYKNMAVENGYSLDSIHYNFTNPSQCWGKFEQNTGADPVILHYGCFGAKMKQGHDGGCSMLAVDVDNDGDLDILLGNRFSDGLTEMVNGKINNGKTISKNDTMIIKEPGLAGTSKTVGLSGYVAAFQADATNDGVQDIIVSQYSPATDTTSHKTYLYRNDGTAIGNHYTYVTDNFLQETMLDEGEHAAPAFVDFNGDGLMDLVIATQANQSGGYAYDHLELYKNIGTANKAVYKKVDNDFASLTRYQIGYLAPTFADIDGDGRPDMLVGRQDGKTMYFKNMADSGGSLQMKLVAVDYQNIRAGGFSTPCFGHISSDTLFDLVMGRDSGTFIYYQNMGSRTKPVFKKITDSLGSVRTNIYYYGNWVYDSKGRLIDSTRYLQPIGRSAPVLADLDHDGKMDLVSGSFYGEMFFWFDIQDHMTGTFARTDTVFYNTLTKKKENKFLGLFTMPSAADLDGDGYPDMLVGNGMGGILYYGSQKMKMGIAPSTYGYGANTIDFSLYPNPSHGSVFVTVQDPRHGKIEMDLTNALGTVVRSFQFDGRENQQEISLVGMAPGVYFASVHDGAGRVGVRKIIVN